MKAITFSTIAYSLIAIGTVVILLTILNALYPEFMGRGFCKVYDMALALPLPGFLKPSIPECSLGPKMERIKLEKGEAKDIANYLIKCWKKVDEGKGGESFVCYELFIKDVETDEAEVTGILKNKNYCNLLPNNYLDIEKLSYDCGNENKIYWNISMKGRDLTIIMKYNPLAHRIEVK
ncbi:MAG: hypothetical protein QXQ40_02140 [Candidatus Aenigmatarchaeota archaeon]